MEETLDGDRLLTLLEDYLAHAEHERAAALVDIAEGVELLFSSRQKRMRFSYLRQKQKRTLRRRRGGAVAA